jgi:hypothetical protein
VEKYKKTERGVNFVISEKETGRKDIEWCNEDVFSSYYSFCLWAERVNQIPSQKEMNIFKENSLPIQDSFLFLHRGRGRHPTPTTSTGTPSRRWDG